MAEQWSHRGTQDSSTPQGLSTGVRSCTLAHTVNCKGSTCRLKLTSRSLKRGSGVTTVGLHCSSACPSGVQTLCECFKYLQGTNECMSIVEAELLGQTQCTAVPLLHHFFSNHQGTLHPGSILTSTH